MLIIFGKVVKYERQVVSKESASEHLRLKSLHESRLLDLPPSNALNTLVELAKRLFNVKIVAISLVDKDRQWFKAQIGLEVAETSRALSFCSHTIAQESPLIVNDASKDKLFANNLLVTESPNIRFYSGVSLVSSVGFKLGAFCLIDDSPRLFTYEELMLQKKLASLIEAELNRLSLIPLLNSPNADSINQSLLKVMNVFLETDDHSAAYDVMLDELKMLTDSEFGLIAEKQQIESNTYLSLKAISHIAWEDLNKKDSITNGEDGLSLYDLNGLVGEPVKIMTAIIVEDISIDKRAKSFPFDVDIYNYCGIPIMSGDEAIGVVGLGNRKQGFSKALINTIKPFILTVAILIQRDRVLKERELYNKRLFNVANIDDVTGLPNRRSLGSFVNKLINKAEPTETFALCYLDIDGFKQVNDKFGHVHGDEILKSVASRLQKAVPKGDFVGRISGDEFIVIFHKPQQAMFDQLMESLEVPFLCELQAVELSASAGISMFPKDGNNIDTLLRHADQAMYQAKREGKNRLTLFDISLQKQYQQQAERSKAVINALKRHEIVAYLQPKFSMKNKAIEGFEVLSRWQHPDKGLLSPAAFLPDIQETYAQVLHDDYMFVLSVELFKDIRKINPNFTLNINISSEYFNDPLFLDRATSIAEQNSDVPQHIILEIVESTALGELQAAIDRLSFCKDLGYSISLDDFGTSYSSLTYFRALPVDEVKIDKSFIDDILKDPYDLSIVEAIIKMSTAFSRAVVAEGVESEAQFLLLQEIGCNTAQGYLFAKPMPIHDIAAFCHKNI